MDTYRHGLDGPQAAWVNHIYHGHRTFPESLLAALDHVKKDERDEAAMLFRAAKKAESQPPASLT